MHKSIRIASIGLVLAVGVSSLLDAHHPAYAQSAGAGGIEEIVVTARRREESLQSVPVSVSVLSGDTLEQRAVVRPDELVYQLPNIQSRPNAGRRSVQLWEMRGISASDALMPQDPSIAYYVDEVVLNHSHGSISSFFDIANVQALYGPQGTLFGRNTTGGAVLVTTNKPVEDFESRIKLTGGNYDRRDFEAMINIPVTEDIALRAAGRLNRRDGFTEEIPSGTKLDDDESEGWRISARWNVSDDIQTTFIYDGTHRDDNGTSNVLVGGPICGATFPLKSSAGPVVFNETAPLCGFAPVMNGLVAAQNALGIRDVFANSESFAKEKTKTISNVTTINLSEGLLLKNIAAYRTVDVSYGQDLDGTGPIPPGGGNLLGVVTGIDADQVSEELQLQGESEDLDWVVGGYYFREKGLDFAESVQFQFGPAPWPASTTDSEAINKSYSVFAQGTWKTPFLDGLSLTAGARYTWDKREIDWLHSARLTGTQLYICRLDKDGVAGVDPDPFGPQAIETKRQNCSAKRDATFKEPTWTVSLDYQWNDEVLTYVAHRHGYHSGGFNGRGSNTTSFASFDPEIANDIEVGIKSQFDLDGVAVRANLALFHTWYTDLQKTVADLGPPVATIVTNAAKATIKGLELDLSVRPNDYIELSGFYGYADGNHKEFETLCDASYTGCTLGTPLTLEDIPFNNSKHTLGATLNFDYPLPRNIGDLNFIANYAWRSDDLGAATNFPVYEPASFIPSYGLLNLSLGLNGIGGTGLDLRGFVRNVTDEEYITSSIAIAGQFGFTPATFGEPRTFGVEVTYSFGPDN